MQTFSKAMILLDSCADGTVQLAKLPANFAEQEQQHSTSAEDDSQHQTQQHQITLTKQDQQHVQMRRDGDGKEVKTERKINNL